MSDLPEGLHDFLGRSGWSDAAIDRLPGDASFRRYFRVRRPNGKGAMLMHAPPDEEDPGPFLQVAEWLTEHGMRAPEIFAAEPEAGWVLTEDFGEDRMRDWLDVNPEGEEDAYLAAIDALVALHGQPPGPFPAYNMETYQREADLFIEWYSPAMGLEVDVNGYRAAWSEVLAPLETRSYHGVTVLRDYHAENIMLLGSSPKAPQGLIDFQDALVGHPAYDLVSLLQDARRDVDPDFADMMFEYYRESRHRLDGVFFDEDDHFIGDYATLGAQRNAKIVGIFTRLYKRDGKSRYLDMIPRVWTALEADLRYPALAPVAQWFAANIPDELRQSGGGTIA